MSIASVMVVNWILFMELTDEIHQVLDAAAKKVQLPDDGGGCFA